MCSSSGGQNCIIQRVVSSHNVGGRLVYRLREETATYRCDYTRGCLIQFSPPDDEHMCSKHVEALNKLNVKPKVCASSWLITEVKNVYSLLLVTGRTRDIGQNVSVFLSSSKQ